MFDRALREIFADLPDTNINISPEAEQSLQKALQEYVFSEVTSGNGTLTQESLNRIYSKVKDLVKQYIPKPTSTDGA